MNQVFVKSLANLTKMQTKAIELDKTLEKGSKTTKDKLNKSLDQFNRSAKTTLDTFKKIFSVIKSISFASMGVGALLGARGVIAQKQVAEAKTLGVTSQQRGALEFAGRASGFGGDFFKDILSSIRNSIVTEEGASSLAGLGIGINQARNMKPLELLETVLEKAKASNMPMQVLSGFISEITGLDWNTFQALDLGKFKKDFEEGMSYSNNSADSLKSIGEGLNRVMTSFTAFIDKTLEPLAPLMDKIFTNFAKGIQAIGNSPEFNKMLKGFGEWIGGISQNFDKSFTEALKEIPAMLGTMKEVFFGLISGLSQLISYIPFIGDETTNKLRRISDDFAKKAELSSIENEKRALMQDMPKLQNRQDIEKYAFDYIDKIGAKIYKSDTLSKEEKEAQMDKLATEIQNKVRLEININNGDESKQLIKNINLTPTLSQSLQR